MKNVRGVSKCLALILLVILVAKPVIAQTPNAQALNFFRIGLNAKEPGEKIAAYKLAIERDSLFVDALYNLGLVYKKQQEYASAAHYLYKAYNAQPHRIKNELKLQILYELGIAYKKLGKSNDCEDALRGAKGLAVDKTVRATISFELGRFLYEQNRYEEALAELQEGHTLSPANKSQFKTFINLVEGAIELQRLCEAAEKAIAGSNPEQARSILGQIKAKGSGNEYLKARMAGIDSLLDAEAKKNTLTTWYDQAQKYAAEGKLEMAIAAYEKLLHQAGDYKDAKINLEKARQALTQNQFNEKLQAEYAAGETAMRSRNWPRAIFAFENVLKMAPNSHDARQRLEEAQSELERESTDAIVARYYAEGVSALNRNDLGGALAALEKVHRLNPDYRDVAGLLAELENALQKNAKQLSVSPAAAVASSADLETLYQDALLSMEKQDWVQAEAALEKLQLLQPSYRDVTDQLATVRAHLVLAESSVTAAQSGAQDNISLYVGGALVALILLPLLGFVVFSPATRANIHLLRSNYKAAAQIYEKILTRHPDRLKLYPILANIYLMLGRHDQQAMKVYKTILQLKLATHKYEEINSIVAQNYLTEGRTDTDAIEVLENALKAERHKQEQG